MLPSPKGGAIGESDFGDRAWKNALAGLGLAAKDSIRMAPYNCREQLHSRVELPGILARSEATD